MRGDPQKLIGADAKDVTSPISKFNAIGERSAKYAVVHDEPEPELEVAGAMAVHHRGGLPNRTA